MIRALFLISLILWSCNAGIGSTWDKSTKFPKEIKWKKLMNGLYYAEISNPYHSKISDNIISLVKINPDFFKIDVFSCTKYDSIPKKVKDWDKKFDLNVIINAGMYNPADGITAQGFMKSGDYKNNPVLKNSFRALAVFNPENSNFPAFNIIDMENEPYDSLMKPYNTIFQSIRMVDCRGEEVVWKPKRLIYSSMCVLAADSDHNIILAFSRSPLSANQMSELLLNIPLKIHAAMYLEGGPECNLYIRTPDTLISKIGSYVSTTYPTDTNTRAWRLPNIIGFQTKKN